MNDQTTSPFDLPALRARIERAKERPVPPGLAGILALDALALLDRVEAAEKKLAAVESVLESYGEQSHECGSGDCCRCTLDDFRAALDGGA